MLRLRLSVTDLAGLRFAFSPLWEIVASVRVLGQPAAHTLHLPWIRSAGARLKGAGADVSLLRALVPVPTRAIPGFLAPTPLTPLPSLELELEALAGTEPELCRDEVHKVFGVLSGPLAVFDDDPAAGLRALVGQIRAYHEVVLEPDWPKIRGLLEGDMMHRGRRLAQGGAARLFADLDPSIAWQDGTVMITHSVAGDHDLDERGLVLVPSAFTWPRVFTKVARPWIPVVRYPARGIAGLWAASQTAPDGLSQVIGRTRARLLAELDAPASTTELARRTSLAPGGVSAHLTRLRAAGLVTSHRTGAVVLYARTSLGDQLLRPR
ncbi:winged helix-turn-helix transcriptional regulator [Nonomuraea basaltis]|nr:winged helix-turn-helix transcriptional regulator [Nonomuraea basaltis]